ncbi:hypothetical protein SanaruYs_06290 [Chryseotalea sanaruensis]|uniref:Squalene cyclase C-terminal domain-containing protein n=1 Tax=Chryseotalea sanaruensis TaxID=2482724 RepID=A0A401U628_9BACT|nr:hypothetical protein [Chryseotalea sanaruensis]GCC50414.1 hypothetical protein SanaruYs_06290 [Chryseotalea sanaruensis]
MDKQQILDWLLEGDVSIQYQVWRDLLGVNKKKLQNRIANEGWGLKFLSKRNSDGHWGAAFYQPKWTSTFYTLLDLRNLNCPSNNKIAKEAIELVLQNGKADDGGIPLGPSTTRYIDVCANGMFLNYASYFSTPEKKLHSIIDSILDQIMPDGGFNCRTTRSGAKHSSLHTSLSVLEGLTEFQKAGYTYRKDEILRANESALAFILLHQLFLSDRSGQIINKDFLKLTFPCRWRYDILRAMDFFQYAGIKWDNRMEAALGILKSKRNKEGTWNMATAHAGQVHFKMEKAGKPSRWNTLRALRVMKHFGIDY